MISLRKYIRQVLLTEAAKGPEDLDPGDFISVERTGDWIRFELLDRDYGQLGLIMISPAGSLNRAGESMQLCSGAWEVTSAWVKKKGFGPLLYDIAMEWTGEAGLMADRRSVSPSAMAVWDFYLANRVGKDVQVKQLDILRPKRIRGTITPDDESDDCPQDKYLNNHYITGDNWENGWTGTDEDIKDFLNSPLTKAYYKTSTPTLDALGDKIVGLDKL